MNRGNVKRLVIIFAGLVLSILIIPFLIPIPDLENMSSIYDLKEMNSLFVEVDGIDIHYKKAGSGQSKIILLHGFGASTYSWREVMESLADYGSVFAYDRPAFGLSERPMPEDYPSEWKDNGFDPYGKSSQDELLIHFMDALEIEEAVLIGNSMGGGTAVLTAQKYPERVKALVLVDASVYGSGKQAWYMSFVGLPQIRRLGPLLVRSISEDGMDTLDKAWHDMSLITDEIKEGYRKPLRAENWDRALWELSTSQDEVSLVEGLGDLSLPVLVVSGDDDRLIPMSSSIQLAEDIPDAELVIFEKCGHVPQEECPQAFLEAVMPFLEQLR
ncbi:MAG: alpha/beta hydrolase [Anaerolineaceae bacterium]|nr:alpha/beta hydrolase [Anaerolineaceae bacterium]